MTRNRDSRLADRTGSDQGRLRAAYRAALEFLACEPWLQLGNSDYVILELEGDPDLLVAVVMGAAREEFGLMVACGPQAEAQVRRMIEGSADEGTVEGMDVLALYVDRLNRLPDFMRAEVKRAGLKAKGGTRVPYYMSKRPYHHLQKVSARDLRRLHAVVRGLLIAQERSWLDPGADVRPRLRLVGDPLLSTPAPGALDVQPVTSAEGGPDGALPVGSEPVPSPALTLGHQDVAGLPLLKETWYVLLVVLPGRVVGSTEVLRTFIVLEAETGHLMGMHVVGGPQGAVKAADHLLEIFRGQGKPTRPGIGIPAILEVFDQELLGLLTPVLEPAGVRCRYQTKIPPEVAHLLASLNELMASPDSDAEPNPWEDNAVEGFVGGLEDDDYWTGDPSDLALPDDYDPDILPAPGDLKAWKAVERRLIRRAMRAAAAGLRGMKRLTALSDAPMSLQRVVSVAPDQGLVLEDILRGGRCEVTDRSLSHTARPGMVFPGRYGSPQTRHPAGSVPGPGSSAPCPTLCSTTSSATTPHPSSSSWPRDRPAPSLKRRRPSPRPSFPLRTWRPCGRCCISGSSTG